MTLMTRMNEAEVEAEGGVQEESRSSRFGAKKHTTREVKEKIETILSHAMLTQRTLALRK